ncbi:MAG: acyltransferase [Cyanobacteriota/Melainabacteria group bacterium]|nr:acyltransferase [Cyanobacteria bacterium HKST-UBA01]
MVLQQPVRNIKVLTSLRFFAALAIVLYHAKLSFNCLHGLPDSIVFSQGVSFFFILSGFILTYVYEYFQTTKEVILYIGKRVGRLWPLHLVTFLICIFLVPRGLLTAPGNFSDPVTAILNLLMIQSWIPDLSIFFSYNAPSWSISTELFFYLSLPVLLYLSRKANWLPITACALSTGIIIFLCNHWNLPVWSATGLSVQGLVAINPLSRLLEFAVGIGCAQYFKKVADSASTTPLKSTLFEIGAIVLAGLAVWNTEAISQTMKELPIIGTAGSYWLSESGIPLLPFALLIFVFAFQKGLISRLLCKKVFVLLGEISFAVYLVHYPLIKYQSYYLPQYRSAEALAIFLAVLLILSHLLYRLVEMPARSVISDGLKKLLDRENNSSNSIFSNLRIAFKASAVTSMELVALIGLVLIAHPGIDTITDTDATYRLQSSYCKGRNIAVGNNLEIQSLNVIRTDNQTTLEMVMKSKKDQTVNHFASVQLLTPDKKEHYLQLSRIAPLNSKLKSNSLWTARIELPIGKSTREVSDLGIILAQKEFLDIRGGKTDMDGKRLLIPLTRAQISDSSKHSSPVSY